MPFAGSRRKTCCGRLAGCACRRSDIDNISIPDHFGGNFSQIQGGFSYFGFNRCKDQRCKIKCAGNGMVLPLNNCKSFVNNRSFVILTDEDLNCASCNVVYLMTCTVCGLQYVGETMRAAGVRWGEHLAKIRKGDKGQLVYSHFNCDDAHRSVPLEKRVRFQIVEKVKVGDLTSRDQIRRRRMDRELYWMSVLGTVFPLGLNDKVEGFGLHGNAVDARECGFNMYRIKNFCSNKGKFRRGRHRRKTKGGITGADLEEFGRNLARLRDDNFSKIEAFIFSKQRAFLERFVRSGHFLNVGKRISYMLNSYVNFSRKVKPVKKELPDILFDIDFSHKIMEDVNVSAILNSSNVKASLPTSVRGHFNAKIVFKYGKTIGRKILNYNRSLKDSGVSTYDDILRMSCDCIDSPFIHSIFGHVVTGDLNIIEDSGLRELCSFGTKFRENPVINIAKIKSQFVKNIDSFITKISRKFSTPKSALKEWRGLFIRNFLNKIYTFHSGRNYKLPVLSSNESKSELVRLQGKYIITVVDKAANNFAFTCKKYYFIKLAEELGMNNLTPGNETYSHIDRTEGQIVEKIKSDIMEFRIKPGDKDEKLALLYQTPKFHKNPPKMRYIAGNVSTVTSSLDSVVALILKMAKTHFRNYCKKKESFSDIRYYFDVQTSMEVRAMFDMAQGEALSISVNDFSTLYTLFDHDHLLGNMSWLFQRLGKNSGFQFVRVSYSRAWWVKDNSVGNVYSVMEILDMIDYLVRNTHVKALGNIFRQDKGIIMGGKSSGWLSDCSLMVDEFKYIEGKVRGGLLDEARVLKYFSRYRDDCTTLNVGSFMDISAEIYPPSLSLTQENDDFEEVNVLDLHVTIQQGTVITRVYCKTDDFPFDVISLPFLASNLDSKVCYMVFLWSSD